MMQSETTPVADHAATTPTAVPAVHVNALNTAETEEAVESAGVSKTKQSKSVTFILALFAGAFIGFGALFFLIVTCDPAMTWGPKRFVGGLAFCMGLILVLCCGAELFTGNSLMASNLAARRISLPALVRNWVIVWFGNLLGALILVALIAMAGTMGLNDGLVGETAVSTAISKVTLDPLTLFARGVLCNVLHRRQGARHPAADLRIRGDGLRTLRGQHVLPADRPGRQGHGLRHRTGRHRRPDRTGLAL